MNPTIGQIIEVIEEKARPDWQEEYDNTGWQILLDGYLEKECSGLLLCVDVTPAIVHDASSRGCNLIISHHPLIFRGLKRIEAGSRVSDSIIETIKNDISIYSCHTSIDSAPAGVSHYLANKLNLRDIEPLHPGQESGTGIGITGFLPSPLPVRDLIEKIKDACESPIARCSGIENLSEPIRKIAIGGGACGDLIPLALEKSCQMMITSDVKHNQFIDYADKIGVVDLGHYETERCTKEIFYKIITEKFPNFVPYYSTIEHNPLTYL